MTAHRHAACQAYSFHGFKVFCLEGMLVGACIWNSWIAVCVCVAWGVADTCGKTTGKTTGTPRAAQM